MGRLLTEFGWHAISAMMQQRRHASQRDRAKRGPMTGPANSVPGTRESCAPRARGAWRRPKSSRRTGGRGSGPGKSSASPSRSADERRKRNPVHVAPDCPSRRDDLKSKLLCYAGDTEAPAVDADGHHLSDSPNLPMECFRRDL
jgi:hypothetical protein